MHQCVLFLSYGECSVYISQTTVCDRVLRPDSDYVYARSTLGDQSAIALLLNKNIETVIAGDGDQECMNLVFRALCHYYLPPCGNSTHTTFPSSLCPKECRMVQSKCGTMWNTILSAFNTTTNPVIQCNDTSKFLFPVPNCCTDAGLDPLLHLDSSTPPQTNSTLKNNNRGVITRVAVGTTVLFLLAASVVVVIFVLLAVLFIKRHKREQFKRAQLDIMAM